MYLVLVHFFFLMGECLKNADRKYICIIDQIVLKRKFAYWRVQVNKLVKTKQ